MGKRVARRKRETFIEKRPLDLAGGVVCWGQMWCFLGTAVQNRQSKAYTERMGKRAARRKRETFIENRPLDLAGGAYVGAKCVKFLELLSKIDRPRRIQSEWERGGQDGNVKH